jgi:hypothetical protein
VVRISASSNPRPRAVGTVGPDWGTRVSGQRGIFSAQLPAEDQAKKLKRLRRSIGLIGQALKAKHWDQVSSELARANALARMLPHNRATLPERKQLIALEKQYAKHRPSTVKKAAKSKPKANPSKRKSPAPQRQEPRRRPKAQGSQPRDLDTRFLDRAAFGYDPPK